METITQNTFEVNQSLHGPKENEQKNFQTSDSVKSIPESITEDQESNIRNPESISKIEDSNPNSTTQLRPIDIELAQASAAQRARQSEMKRYSTIAKAWKGVKNTAGKDHNTIRLSATILVIIISLFSSLIMIIASVDMSHTSEPLYAHSDMIKFMNDLREKALRETPPEHPVKWSKDANQTWFSGIEREIRFLMEQWWPLAHSQYESADVILNERNFFAANFDIFRHSFTVFNLLANILLFAIWLIFITAKEVRRIKMTKPAELNNSWKARDKVVEKDDNEEGGKKRNVLIRGSRRVYKRVIRYLKRVFWWIPPIKNEWFNTLHPSGMIWERNSFVVIFTLCGLHFLIEFILLERPTFFPLLLHQISFIVLSVLCLASTFVELVEEDEESQETTLFVRSEPKSLRGSFRGTNLNSSLKNPDSGSKIWSTGESSKLFGRNSRIAPLPSVETVIEENENEPEAEAKNMNEQFSTSERKTSFGRSISQEFLTNGKLGVDGKIKEEEYPEESNPFSDEISDEDDGEGEGSNGNAAKSDAEKGMQTVDGSMINDAASSMKRSMIF